MVIYQSHFGNYELNLAVIGKPIKPDHTGDIKHEINPDDNTHGYNPHECSHDGHFSKDHSKPETNLDDIINPNLRLFGRSLHDYKNLLLLTPLIVVELKNGNPLINYQERYEFRSDGIVIKNGREEIVLALTHMHSIEITTEEEKIRFFSNLYRKLRPEELNDLRYHYQIA